MLTQVASCINPVRKILHNFTPALCIILRSLLSYLASIVILPANRHQVTTFSKVSKTIKDMGKLPGFSVLGLVGL